MPEVKQRAARDNGPEDAKVRSRNDSRAGTEYTR
jgi:hypothetical protein